MKPNWGFYSSDKRIKTNNITEKAFVKKKTLKTLYSQECVAILIGFYRSRKKRTKKISDLILYTGKRISPYKIDPGFLFKELKAFHILASTFKVQLNVDCIWYSLISDLQFHHIFFVHANRSLHIWRGNLIYTHLVYTP